VRSYSTRRSAFAKSPTVAKTPLEEREFVKNLIEKATHTRDALPYTDEFESLKQRYQRRFERSVSDAAFWQIIARVGKRGGLARPKPMDSKSR
jgi:hypothetical protein